MTGTALVPYDWSAVEITEPVPPFDHRVGLIIEVLDVLKAESADSRREVVLEAIWRE